MADGDFDNHFLFVNRSCTGCKGAMGICSNPRYMPHVCVLALGEPAFWSDGDSEYKPNGSGQGGQIYNRGTRPIISPNGETMTVMGLMNHYGVNTVPTMIVDLSEPRGRKLAGALAILGEMQRIYPRAVAPSGRVTTQSPGLAQFNVEMFSPSSKPQWEQPKQIGNIGSMRAKMVG